MGLLGGPGKPVPSHAELRAARSRVWGLLIALIFLAVCQLVDWHQSQDVVTGAHGTFPAAFGAGAPVAPERVVRQKTDGEVLVHGLSIQSPGSSVTAVNLRTGKEYWRYERRDTGRVVWSIEASGRTVVAGFGDGRLVAIDLRTGKPLWQVEVHHDEGYRSAELAGGQAVTEAPGAVRAFAERDGRSLWTAKTPKSCPEVLVYTVYVLPDHLSVVPVFCNTSSLKRDEYNLLLGIDNRTGKILWQQRTADPKLTVRADEHTLAAAPDPETDPETVQLLEVNRHGITPRAVISPDAWDTAASGGGIVVSATDFRDGSVDRDTLLRAYAARDGHLAWRLRAPTGQEYGSPQISDGRVYVVRQPSLTDRDVGRRIRTDLLILDAGTGRLLHTLRLPAMTARADGDGFMTLDVRDIADGAVSISWRVEEGGMLIATD
ncbi:outer membrane protein assembly factor BamB family protein [Streptomyces sp. NBC_01361]|uniref:outer membrane protein assembly factor BamB family protein n=1 Tax=Streptomyces sp. NBC_01361 TaxID=2903838 RepID=UPI002E31F26E|nr:PQQ-binding-like beta-propeller repeat protein [Streptomyces sp. NBC_01361]